MKFFFCIKSKSWFQYLNKNIQFWFSNLLFYYTLIIKLYLAIVMYSIAPRNFQDVLLCKQKYSILIFAIFCFTGSVSHHVRLVHLRRVLLGGFPIEIETQISLLITYCLAILQRNISQFVMENLRIVCGVVDLAIEQCYYSVNLYSVCLLLCFSTNCLFSICTKKVCCFLIIFKTSNGVIYCSDEQQKVSLEIIFMRSNEPFLYFLDVVIVATKKKTLYDLKHKTTCEK